LTPSQAKRLGLPHDADPKPEQTIEITQELLTRAFNETYEDDSSELLWLRLLMLKERDEV
jgi:enoyl-CoA hydratase/carnithine racemase